MININFNNHVYSCRDDQTVLDVLLDNGCTIPYSCKMGACVTCIMQTDMGDVPDEACAGLRQTLVKQGQFLPCVCLPTTDMTVSTIDYTDLFNAATVTEIERFSNDICRVFLKPDNHIDYRAGQFMNLRREDGISRSYSLASVPSQQPSSSGNQLEFHVKRLRNGLMSNWILDELRPGDVLGIQGPIGHCLYEAGRADQNILMIGNGTGLAPLLGIARDALSSGHTGQIKVYHGSGTLNGLYLDKELRQMALEYNNFIYIPCISRGRTQEKYCQGRANEVALRDHPNLKDWRLYICGYPAMVESARSEALVAGAKVEEIYVDPFELKDLRHKARN